jgi:hypothetical protein
MSSKAKLPGLHLFLAGRDADGGVILVVLDIGEKYVPHHRHKVHIKYAKLRRHQAETNFKKILFTKPSNYFFYPGYPLYLVTHTSC